MLSSSTLLIGIAIVYGSKICIRRRQLGCSMPMALEVVVWNGRAIGGQNIRATFPVGARGDANRVLSRKVLSPGSRMRNFYEAGP